MDVVSGLVDFFQGGGLFMLPIAIVFALGMAVAIERWTYLQSAERSNRQLWNRVSPHLEAGNLRAAMTETERSSAAIAEILAYGLTRVASANTRDDVEKAMEESLMDATPRLEKRTHYLSTFAYLCTLLGLLGTVMGLIGAFAAVATADAAEKASLLSASISEAMNCTAFGLMTAIPLVLLHAVLQTKATDLIDSLEMASVKFLNTLTEQGAGQKKDSLMTTGHFKAPVHS